MKHYGPSLPKEVCWDMSIAERAEGVRVLMHKPTRRAPILRCDMPWEGSFCGYGKVFFDGEKYRLYYRGLGHKNGFGSEKSHGVWCVAFSYDGKTFFRPDLGIFEFKGSKHNNIVMQIENYAIDNFSIVLDLNPDCPPAERYKAFAGETPEGQPRRLRYYVSEDGLHFNEVDLVKASGAFDSLNICFYDDRKGRYALYLRGMHDADPAYKIPYEKEGWVRDVRVAYSTDMENWTEPKPLTFGEGDTDEIQLYTNGVMMYPETDMYLAMPTRYIDRALDLGNFRHLPDLGGDRIKGVEGVWEQRLGTAVTETMLMTSRDGESFLRTKEAFWSPGLETRGNWTYGDGYFAVGMAETASDFEGEPEEFSLYLGDHPNYKQVTFDRYTIRKDGFFSYRADFEGGELVTKPFTFDGTNLTVNFSTSALGYLRIEILDEDGNALEGYDTGRLFGNSLTRPCDFAAPLADLAGKAIRFRITMRDADLYSFRFA